MAEPTFVIRTAFMVNAENIDENGKGTGTVDARWLQGRYRRVFV